MDEPAALLWQALELCMEAHAEQVDRDGMPHVFHAFRVAQKQITLPRKIVGLLHDAVEDAEDGEQALQLLNTLDAEFPVGIAEAVQCMTRGKDESWSKYIDRVCQNEDACYVKLADIEDNFSPSRVDRKIAEKYPMYVEAYEQICDHLGINRFLLNPHV